MLKHWILVCTLGLAAPAAFALSSDLYDASGNALPSGNFTRFDAQNFASTFPLSPYFGTGFTPNPDQSVSGGIYDSGLTDSGKYTFWYNSAVTLDESQTIQLDVNLKVLSSTTAISGSPSNGLINRAGVAIALTTDNNNYTELYFTPSQIFLNGAGRNQNASYALDTTASFHDYLLTVQGSNVTVSVDGTPQITGGQTFNASTVSAPTLPDWATFGDITSDAAGEYQLKSFSISSVPEPMCIGALAPLLMIGRRQRA